MFEVFNGSHRIHEILVVGPFHGMILGVPGDDQATPPRLHAVAGSSSVTSVSSTSSVEHVEHNKIRS